MKINLQYTDGPVHCRMGIQVKDPPRANPMAVFRDMSDDLLASGDIPAEQLHQVVEELRQTGPTALNTYIYTFQGRTTA